MRGQTGDYVQSRMFTQAAAYFHELGLLLQTSRSGFSGEGTVGSADGNICTLTTVKCPPTMVNFNEIFPK